MQCPCLEIGAVSGDQEMMRLDGCGEIQGSKPGFRLIIFGIMKRKLSEVENVLKSRYLEAHFQNKAN